MNKSIQMMQTLEEVELADPDTKVDHIVATDHTHKWETDVDGNGKSVEDSDHSHEVIAFLAMPCTDDGHEHQLQLPAATKEAEWVYEE